MGKAMSTQQVLLPTHSGSQTTFSAGNVHVHVWLNAGDDPEDHISRLPDSGEWQVIATTSPDPLNLHPRGQEFTRKTFHYTDPHQCESVSQNATEYVHQLLARFCNVGAPEQGNRLTSTRIQDLSSQPGVRSAAVRHFLKALGSSDLPGTLDNLQQDAQAYRWDTTTQEAIRTGIMEHFNNIQDEESFNS